MPTIISWITVALFNVSMLSGLVVAFFYKPSLAYESVQKLTYLIPYGDMFRALHYFSSEAFLIFTCIHVAVELRKSSLTISPRSWNYSILALTILFLLMFTGYVLKADLSGFSAGEVALSLLKQTPLIDKLLPLLSDNTMFVWKFYLWHLIFLPIILTYALLLHVKTFRTKYWAIGLGLSVLCMMIFAMPQDIPHESVNIHVTGPWFFRGAENLLMLGVHPVIVDGVLMMPFIVLVGYFYQENWRRLYRYLLLLWCGAYALFSLI